MTGGDNGGLAAEIYRKLKRLPGRSMFGMHMVDQLCEIDRDRVILSLVVDKGSNKFSITKEELARKWSWHSRELLIEMFNDEVMMAEEIFKAMYLEDGNENNDEEVVTPANKLSLIGTKWGKKVTSEEGGKETLIKLIAKVLWRGYHNQAEVAIALLKKKIKKTAKDIWKGRITGMVPTERNQSKIQ